MEVLYPTLVGRRARGDHEGFDRALIDSIRYALMGLLLIAAVCGGAAHSILEVFGPGFSRASAALALLVLYPALASIVATQTQALYVIDRPGLTSTVGIARLLVTIALTVLLVPSMGIAGPAIALLAGFVLDVLWKAAALMPVLSRPLRVTWPLRERLGLLGAYVAGFLAANAVEHLAASATLPPRLALSLLTGAVAYWVVLLMTATNGRDQDRLLEAIKARHSWGKRRREWRRRVQESAQSSS